uniref:Cohesin subunit sa-2 isoform x1 n=2 Tax=Triatominae TaxID=70999 RepID=A0A161M4E8_TRIIF
MEAGGPTEDIIVDVKSRLTLLMDVMKMMLTQQHSQIYKEEAYLIICDLLVVFCDQLATNTK